jgi:hypothetical protein
MFDFLMLADAASHATQDVQSGLADHNILLIVAGGVVLVAPVVLKAFGVNVPFLDPLLDAGLSLLEKATTKTPAPPPDPAQAKADLQKIADKVDASQTPADNVVPIKPTDPPAGK